MKLAFIEMETRDGAGLGPGVGRGRQQEFGFRHAEFKVPIRYPRGGGKWKVRSVKSEDPEQDGELDLGADSTSVILEELH